jgi:hypothetical protein
VNRRGFITGLISLVAAPAIVRAGSLMPIKAEVIKHIPVFWEFAADASPLPLTLEEINIMYYRLRTYMIAVDVP